MDFCFRFIAIFLIFDVCFAWAVDDKSSGNQNSSKKENSFEPRIELSSNIANNPFLQNAFLHRPIENNPFLYSFSGKIKNPNQAGTQQNISLPQENKSSSIATFVISNNPFLNKSSQGTDTRGETGIINWPGTYSSAPVTQRPRPPEPVDTFTFPSNDQSSEPSILPDRTPLIFGWKTKSEQKCDEYVREVVGTTDIMPLVGVSTGVIKKNNVCDDANRLVIGGTEARIGEFPHMVALGRRDQTFKLICGGTLISHTWVLSAAHCTHGPNGAPFEARIGFHRLTDQQSGVTVAIKSMTRHPDYAPPAMYADIALIKLASAVTFTTSIRPACLYQQYDSVPVSAWISGWGVTEFAGDQTDQLQKAKLDMVDNLMCAIAHNNSLKEVPRGVTPNMICAGDPRGGWTRDTCQGDSGGPLQVIHPKNKCLFQVIGVTSFGQGCAIINSPGVYTRVSHYIPWIESIVWPYE